MEQLAGLVRAKLGSQHAQEILTLGTRALSSQQERILQRLEVDRVARRTMVVANDGYPLVGTATLELASLPLHEQIRQFAREALSVGCHQVQLLPVFLLPGVHVMDDIPTEVALAHQSLGQAVVLNQRPYLGVHPGLVRILASQVATLDADANILLSHGSRRSGSYEAVEAVADQLGAVVAYWSVKPTLEEQLKVLADAGHKRIAIVPYFLFSGGITDAIAQRVASLQELFPRLQLTLAQPIGVSHELADLIVDLIEKK
jgi:sirohydrochlorin ferrochelatase